MKKLILSAVTTVLFTSTIAMADEFFVGGGYDFYRKSSEKNIKNKKLKQGIKIKAEWMPFENDNLKVGFGSLNGKLMMNGNFLISIRQDGHLIQKKVMKILNLNQLHT